MHVCMLLYVYTADRRCKMKLDIKDQPTGLTIYEVWEAMVALTSTCVRGRQLCGRAYGLGAYKCGLDDGYGDLAG